MGDWFTTPCYLKIQFTYGPRLFIGNIRLFIVGCRVPKVFYVNILLSQAVRICYAKYLSSNMLCQTYSAMFQIWPCCSNKLHTYYVRVVLAYMLCNNYRIACIRFQCSYLCFDENRMKHTQPHRALVTTSRSKFLSVMDGIVIIFSFLDPLDHLKCVGILSDC